MGLEILAPAKLNLTLEVLGRRLDGYHEIVSVMQTIDIDDVVRVEKAPRLTFELSGRESSGVPVEGPDNLAFRAAMSLARESGRSNLGASIQLEKGIPAGLGLGGGSSDAAAVLRALNLLWEVGMGPADLEDLASEIGSDVSFFLWGGTALVSGRGERVEALPDIQDTPFTLFLPGVRVEDKTRRMYSTISPDDYSDGGRTRSLVAALRRGETIDSGTFANAFDARIHEVVPMASDAMTACDESGVTVHAAGSGPAFFSTRPFSEIPEALSRELHEAWGIRAVACRTLSRSEALAYREF